MTPGVITPRMTPPCRSPRLNMTPPLQGTLQPQPESVFADTVAAKLAANPAARRRSSMAQRLTEIRPRLSMAVNHACNDHASALAKAAQQELSTCEEEREEVEAEIKHEVLRSRCRHRLSIMKAAEVLQAAGLEEDEELSTKLTMVKEAVDAARKRHWASIVAKHADEKGDDAYLCRRPKDPRFLALMKTRASVAGRRVHCGPRQSPQAAQRRKGARGRPEV